MVWRKQGLVHGTNGLYEWNRSHAQLPTVEASDGQRWRIFYAARDQSNRAQTSFIEVMAGDPKRIVYEHPRPILSLGKPGAFDDCGIMPGWLVRVGDTTYLYYTGWSARTVVPYSTEIGLAVSRNGGASFERYAEGPLFGPTVTEPYINGSPCVIQEHGIWRCWYFSCTKWETVKGKWEPFYHIKYAESPDGIRWKREGIVAVDYKSDGEAGIGRGSVLRENGVYKMWFSYRSAVDYRNDRKNSYRIGYAESPDGFRWQRMDDRAGIDVSDGGWDSQMIAYPYVVSFQGKKYMFYNGNGFGQTGFGYAIDDYQGE